MNLITQFFLKIVKPTLLSLITKLVYKGKNICIEKGLKVDSIPRIIIDKNAKLFIGKNVEFRRNVEIRVHGKAHIRIGNNVKIDRGVRILAANSSEINIEDGVKIGLYSVLNGGDSITIGKKSLISGFLCTFKPVCTGMLINLKKFKIRALFTSPSF